MGIMRSDDDPKNENEEPDEVAVELMDAQLRLVNDNCDGGVACVDENDDDHEQGPVAQPEAKSSRQQRQQYQSKKPFWWRRQSGRPSKKQKEALNDPQLQTFHVVKPRYGVMLDWDEVFCCDNNNNQGGGRSSAGGVASEKPVPQLSSSPSEIWWEVGFGVGDNLLCLAHDFPHRHLLGAEVHQAGLGSLFQKLKSALAKNVYYTDYQRFDNNDIINNNSTTTGDPSAAPPTRMSEQGPANTSGHPDTNSDATGEASLALYKSLRIMKGDCTKWLPHIPDQSIDHVLITFPDPFPRYNQVHWRLLQTQVLAEFRRVVKGRLFLATDDENNHQWTRQQVELHNREQENACAAAAGAHPPLCWDLVEPTPPRNEWLPVISKYEQKGWDEGRQTWLSCWEAK